MERASAALREVHWKTYAALQRTQGTKWIEEALISFRGRAVLSNCLVLRFDFIVLRAYAVRRASCLLALRRLDVEVPAARSLDITAILVADSLALGCAPSSAVRRVAAIIVLGTLPATLSEKGSDLDCLAHVYAVVSALLIMYLLHCLSGMHSSSDMLIF